MDRQDIPFLTLTELSGLIERKEVSPVEATEAYLARISEIDDKLNSYITVTADDALAAARQAEQEIARGNYRGLCTARRSRSRTSSIPRVCEQLVGRGCWPISCLKRTQRLSPN